MSEIVLSASVLKPVLAGLSKVVSRKSTLPILQHIRISRENNVVILQATDLDVWATHRQPQPGEPMSLVVPFETLNKIVKALKGDSAITFEQNKTSRLVYQVGNSPVEVKLNGPDLKEWPQEPQLDGSPQTLPASFKDAFREAIECASTDSSRYVINGVCLDVQSKDGHYVVATNGSHLFAANSFEFALAAPVIVPVSKFVQWNGFTDDGDWQLITKRIKDVPWLKFVSNQWSLTAKQVDGNYPNWRQCVPKPDAQWTRISLSSDSVAMLLKNLPLLPGENEPNRPVKIEVAADGVLFKARTRNSQEWTTIRLQEANITGRPVEISLNRDYLLRALRFGLLELVILDSISPMLFQSTGKQMVVMPVRPEAATQPARKSDPPKPAAPPSAATETEERKTMPKENQTAITQARSPLEMIDALKENLKGAIRDLAVLADALKLAEREQKQADKEVEAVRAKLREIQSVKL